MVHDSTHHSRIRQCNNILSWVFYYTVVTVKKFKLTNYVVGSGGGYTEKNKEMGCS